MYISKANNTFVYSYGMVAWYFPWECLSRVSYKNSRRRSPIRNNSLYYFRGIFFRVFFLSFIIVFSPWGVPLLNTIILLSSGIRVTWAHKRFDCRFHDQSILSLIVTTLLGVYFTSLQAMEYQEATFSIADSIYGSTFYIATGFHGIHVVVGTIFLIISCARLRLGQLSKSHHFGLIASIWYWHFVDIVWLFLYGWIYGWGSFRLEG